MEGLYFFELCKFVPQIPVLANNILYSNFVSEPRSTMVVFTYFAAILFCLTKCVMVCLAIHAHLLPTKY